MRPSEAWRDRATDSDIDRDEKPKEKQMGTLMKREKITQTSTLAHTHKRKTAAEQSDIPTNNTIMSN